MGQAEIHQDICVYLSVTASDPEGLQSVIVLLHCILPNFVKFQFHRLYPEPAGSVVKNLPVNAGDSGLIPGLGDPLGKEIPSSILA